MKLKTKLLGAAAVAATVGLGTLTASPAQAAILGEGGFLLTGSTSVTGAGTPNVTVNFSGFQISPGSPFGAFAGLTGTPVILSLPLTDPGTFNTSPATQGSFSNPNVPGFISGLFLNGAEVFFDLDAAAVNQFGFAVNSTDFAIAGPITGTFRSGNTVFGQGTLGANQLGTGSISTISLTAVPTPAMLPGLIGLGVTAMRKRKRQAAEQAEA